MSKVAQRYGVNANLLFTWRRQPGRTNPVGGQEPIELLPVTIADAGSAASPVALPRQRGGQSQSLAAANAPRHRVVRAGHANPQRHRHTHGVLRARPRSRRVKENTAAGMNDANDKDDKAALDAKVEKYRERMAAKVAEIKGALMNWLEPRDSVADSVCITNALLELALDRHVESHQGDGFDLIGIGLPPRFEKITRPAAMTDQLPIAIPPACVSRMLTAAEFQKLADVPPEVEWFANLTNAHTRRAYENARPAKSIGRSRRTVSISWCAFTRPSSGFGSARTRYERRPPPTRSITRPTSPRCRSGFGHANISTTRIYDHRRTRPEDSPTFKVAY